MFVRKISPRYFHRLINTNTQSSKPTWCQRQLSQLGGTDICNRASLSIVSQSVRLAHGGTSGNAWTVHRLANRGVLLLRGDDVLPFLQGLVTNDVTDMKDGGSVAQYAMMLNVQGRVLYDLILYDVARSLGEHSLLIECDAKVRADFTKLMKMYKIRKKVEISDVTEDYSVWASFPPEGSPSSDIPVDSDKLTVAAQDPRVPDFGWRILVRPSESTSVLSSLQEEDENLYHIRRYQWGIAEGTTDLPTGNCFPLESNLVFMNGVSFSKGCYIGQELTARTQHTGATRKRLMPLVFDSEPTKLVSGDTITTDKGKNAGKFRSAVGRYGLGLVRSTDTHGSLKVTGQDSTVYTATAHIPDWWPVEEKDKITTPEKS